MGYSQPRALYSVDAAHRLLVACVAAAAVITFAAYAAQMINFFYLSGGYFWDAGWHSYLFSRFQFPPLNPPVIQQGGGGYYYFSQHLSPLVPLWGGLAKLFNWPGPVAYAIFQGLIHSLLFLVGYGLGETRLKPPWNSVFRIFLGLALAFGPITVDAISYPHFELATPILFLATCYALSKEHLLLGVVSFGTMLLVREDAGLHAFLFFAAFAVAESIRKRGWPRSARITAGFAIAGLVYSLLAFIIIRLFFPGFDNLEVGYRGPGFFDHLTVSFYADRVVKLLELRPELFVVTVLTFLYGVFKRDIAIVFGVLAVMPWLLVSLAAVRDPPGLLFSYYAFPFLIVFAWPWVVAALRRMDKVWQPSLMPSAPAVLIWCAIWLLSVSAYYTLPFAGPDSTEARFNMLLYFVPQISPDSVAKVVTFTQRLSPVAQLERPKVILDDAMLSLLPGESRTKNRFEEANKKNTPQDYVLIYFGKYMQAHDVERSSFATNAQTCFQVVGTNIRIIARGSVGPVTAGWRGLTSKRNCSLFRRT